MKKGLLIYQKIILIQFVFILIVTVAFGIFLYRNNLNKELKEFNTQTSRMKDRLSSNLSIPMWNFDSVSSDKLLSEEVEDKYVYAIVVYQQNGSLYIGKIKSNDKMEIIDDINKYKDSLKESYSVIKEKIIFTQNEEKSTVGEVVIYTTDKYIKEQLFFLIVQTIIQSLLLIIILSGITYFVLNYFLNKPLVSFKGIFEKGAAGDLEARYPVVDNTRDEINELGMFFNRFMDEVKKVIREVVDASSEMSVSAEELSSTISAFSEHAQSEAAASEEITATMEEVSAGIDSVSDNTQFQYSKFNELNNLMKYLSEIIGETARGVSEAQALSKIISKQARLGNESLNLMNNSMANITDSSNKVSDIIGIIDDISNKINLLSLNAAIEAARAGDAGRGFAVVADEISKLADQTATSINDIDGLIKKNDEEISIGMKRIVDSIESIAQIISGVESIDNMMNNIYKNMENQQSTNNSVNKSASELMSRSDEVKNSSEEHKSAVGEVMKSITNINDLIQASAGGAEEMSASSVRLAEVAVSLRKKVDFFKI